MLEWAAYPFSRDLPVPGIEPGSPALQADSFQLSHPGSPAASRLYTVFSSFQTVFMRKPQITVTLAYGVAGASYFIKGSCFIK